MNPAIQKHPFYMCTGCLGIAYKCGVQSNYIMGLINSDEFVRCSCSMCIIKMKCDTICPDFYTYVSSFKCINYKKQKVYLESGKGVYRIFKKNRSDLIINYLKSMKAHMQNGIENKL